MKRWLYALSAALLLSLAGVARVGAQSPTPPARTGSVAGQIVNGTAGGQVPADLKVTLHAWDAQGETVMQEATADAAGAFQFKAVPMQTGWSFGAVVTRDGVTYFSETADVVTDTTNLTLPLTLYDTTTDTASVTVAQLHALFDIQLTELRVVELYVLSNSGDRAVIGTTPLSDGRKVTLDFALPEGANEVSFQGDGANERLALTPNGFAYIGPVLPGANSEQIAISYVLPYASGMTFTHRVQQPVEAASFIVPATAGVKITGAGLSAPVQQSMQSGTTVDIYATGGLPPGAAFAATLTGTPPGMGSTEPPAPTSAPFPWALLIGGGAGLALIAAGLWLWRQNRRPAVPELDLEEAWESALQSIADLDEAHEKGEIPESDYTARRADLQGQARDILREREAAGPPE